MKATRITMEEQGIKVGDVLITISYWYRTNPKWYEVVSTTDKTCVLKSIPRCFRTKYMSNTPGDYCVPNITCDVFDIRDHVHEYMFRESGCLGDEVARAEKKEDGSISIISGSKNSYSCKIFYRWDGKPSWINCD